MDKTTKKESTRSGGMKRFGVIALSAVMMAAAFVPTAVLAENSGGGNPR
jgi:hypothetical protein